jgi:hypothetical protein
VTPHPLHALFERIFGDAQTPDTADRARKDGTSSFDVHSLAMEIEPQPHDTAPSTDSDIALVSGWLDGELDGPALERFSARLAHSPELLEEVSSAEAFLDASNASVQKASPAAIKAAIEAGRPRAKVPTPRHQKWQAWWKWSGIALAMAAVAIVAIVLVSPRHAPTDKTVPMTAAKVPNSNGTAVPGAMEPEIMRSPSLAGKSGTQEGMVPAASEETMPIQRPQTGVPSKP